MASVTASLITMFGGDKERAKEDNPPNRWAMLAPAFLTHMCIGHPYAWSVMSTPLTRELGVVASSASDWSLSQTTALISIVFALQGISAATAGPWLANIGPRASMMIAACCFGGGLALASAGIAAHSLPMLYLGYGVLGGTGVGLAYTPPIQTLINWFPDRKGIASGVTIAGFGSGALVFVPVAQKAMSMFRREPELAGPLSAEVEVEGGRTFMRVASEGGTRLREVVEATASGIADSGFSHLHEGYYFVGTGSTGTAEAMAVFAAGYGAVMAASALAIRRPWPGYAPPAPAAASLEPAASASESGASKAADDEAVAKPGTALIALGNVSPTTVLRTPQFWLMAATFFCVASGGIGLLSVAKPLVKDVMVSSGAATAGFASIFLLILSAGNLFGRIGWAAVSDAIGRRPTFMLFTAGSIPLYLATPSLVAEVVESGSQVALGTYAAACTLAISFMGGTYAILPAYESDLFGSKHVGANHGRMLLASTGAALAGPGIILGLRERATSQAISDLVAQVDPSAFAARFKAPLDDLQTLVESKRVTIDTLLEICPPGTADPTPFLYDSAMYTMTGLMAAAAVAHYMIGPVDPKYFEESEAAAAAAAAVAAAGDATADPTADPTAKSPAAAGAVPSHKEPTDVDLEPPAEPEQAKEKPVPANDLPKHQ